MSPRAEVWRETSASWDRDSPWGTAGSERMPNATRSGGAVGICLDLIGEFARPADSGSSGGALSRSAQSRPKPGCARASTTSLSASSGLSTCRSGAGLRPVGLKEFGVPVGVSTEGEELKPVCTRLERAHA
jgi:hypothetical protein